jgi:hypothetical protein
MTELDLLRALLLISLALAPLGTHRLLLPPSTWAAPAHAAAWCCAAVGLFSSLPALCGVWLLYCVASLGHFLWDRGGRLRSAHELAGCVPFVFSIIASIWTVAGANDLRLLGYGATFSYYAALHGNVLGWMLLGPLAVLAQRDLPQRKVYLAAVLVSFGSFLLVAIGIDGQPALKPLGVLGISIVLPIAQLVFLGQSWTSCRAAFFLACASLLGLATTLVFAWQHELGLLSLTETLGVRPMVSVHGLVNGVVVAPSFLLAVALETRAAGAKAPAGAGPTLES